MLKIIILNNEEYTIYTPEQMQQIKKLKEKSGHGLASCFVAMSHRDWIEEYAIEFLERRHLAAKMPENVRFPK